jgi:hypothetical protein
MFIISINIIIIITIIIIIFLLLLLLQVARGKTEYCAAHGGGIRCDVLNCIKLAVGSKNLCRSHASEAKNQNQGKSSLSNHVKKK